MTDKIRQLRCSNAMRDLMTGLLDLSTDSLNAARASASEHLTDDERTALMTVLIKSFPEDVAAARVQSVFEAIGWMEPLPTEELMSEARAWAERAPERQVLAAATAAVESMSDDRLERFRLWLDRRDMPQRKAANQ